MFFDLSPKAKEIKAKFKNKTSLNFTAFLHSKGDHQQQKTSASALWVKWENRFEQRIPECGFDLWV